MGWIVTVVVALGAVFPAYAKPAKAAQPAARFEANLLTWQQFAALPKKKQAKYLDRVRELIMFMESMQNKFDHETASNSAVDELKEQVAVMMQLMAVMPEAYADDEEFGLKKEGAAKGKPAAAPAADAKGRPAAAPANAVRGGRPVTTVVDQNGKPTATAVADPKGKPQAPVKPVSEPPKVAAPTKPAAEPPKVEAVAKPAPPKAPIASSPETAAAMEAAAKNPPPLSAEGQETDGGGNKIWEKRTKPYRGDVPRWVDGKGWTCDKETVNGKEQTLVFDENIGTCVYISPKYLGGFMGGSKIFKPAQECPEPGAEGVTVGDIKLNEPGQSNGHRCVPRAAWDALDATRRRQIAGGMRYPDNYFKNSVGDGPERTKGEVLGGNTHNPDGSTVGSGNGEMAGTGDAPPPPPPAGPGKPANDNKPPKTEPGKTEPAKTEPPKTEPVACVREQLSCEKMTDKDRAKLKSKFPRKGKGIPCIIGGVFSEYESKGKCKPQRAQLNHTCKTANTTMCDVGVFCLGMVLDDKVKAYVSGLPEGDTKKDLTEEINHAFTVKGTGQKIMRMKICEKVVEEVDKKKDVDISYRCNHSVKGHVEGETSAFKPSIGEKYVACNPAELEGGSGAGWGDQEGWNNRRENVRKMYNLWCNNKDGRNASFGAYFCKECGIIAERIMAANKEATGDACFNGKRTGSAGSGAPAANPVDNPGIINEDDENSKGDGI